MPCKHLFHSSCILPWLNNVRMSPHCPALCQPLTPLTLSPSLRVHLQTNTCPLCRLELPTDNPEYEEFKKDKVRERAAISWSIVVTLAAGWSASPAGAPAAEGAPAGGPARRHVHVTTEETSRTSQSPCWKLVVLQQDKKRQAGWVSWSWCGLQWWGCGLQWWRCQVILLSVAGFQTRPLFTSLLSLSTDFLWTKWF